MKEVSKVTQSSGTDNFQKAWSVPRLDSERAKDPRNFTKAHLDQADWSWMNMPDIIYQFKPSTKMSRKESVPLMSYPIHGKVLRLLPLLPDNIASTVEEFRVEAWLRLDRRIRLQDIIDRMHPEFRVRPNALQTRGGRFRQEFNMVAWDSGNRKSRELEKIVIQKMIGKGIDPANNSTRGITPGLIYPLLGEAGGRIPLPKNYGPDGRIVVRGKSSVANSTIEIAPVELSQREEAPQASQEVDFDRWQISQFSLDHSEIENLDLEGFGVPNFVFEEAKATEKTGAVASQLPEIFNFDFIACQRGFLPDEPDFEGGSFTDGSQSDVFSPMTPQHELSRFMSSPEVANTEVHESFAESLLLDYENIKEPVITPVVQQKHMPRPADMHVSAHERHQLEYVDNYVPYRQYLNHTAGTLPIIRGNMPDRELPRHTGLQNLDLTRGIKPPKRHPNKKTVLGPIRASEIRKLHRFYPFKRPAASRMHATYENNFSYDSVTQKLREFASMEELSPQEPEFSFQHMYPERFPMNLDLFMAYPEEESAVQSVVPLVMESIYEPAGAVFDRMLQDYYEHEDYLGEMDIPMDS